MYFINDKDFFFFFKYVIFEEKKIYLYIYFFFKSKYTTWPNWMYIVFYDLFVGTKKIRFFVFTILLVKPQSYEPNVIMYLLVYILETTVSFANL